MNQFRVTLIVLFAVAVASGQTRPATTSRPAETTRPTARGGFGRLPNVPLPPGPIPVTTLVPDGKPHRLSMHDHQFYIDDDPTVLMAGEMHFGRVLPEDFELRVKQAKAMGLNTLSFYLFWNLSEPREGEFDFTGPNDVRRMLKICQANGMWAILRPGPYCCAEVDYGGIPAWTLKRPGTRIRTNDPAYVEWSRNYINRVGKEVADFQSTRGGPLLMVQMENEYAGASNRNYDYITSLKKIFPDAGFEIPLFTCDPQLGRGPNPYGDDVFRGRNGVGTEQGFAETYAVVGDGPVYVPELYTAWFSGWGQAIAQRNGSIDGIADRTNLLLNHHASFCYYMFFGGTNWGYDTGANRYMPVQTSYDYNAPIDEAGRATPKFYVLREILRSRTGRTLPPVPDDPAVKEFPPITLSPVATLTSTLPAVATRATSRPASMESLDQAYGFVLYRKVFPNGIRGTLHLRRVQDYAITIVNGKTVAHSFIGYGPDSARITLNETGPTTLDILVAHLGRVSVPTNAGTEPMAHKGIMDGVYLDDQEVTDWQNFSLPLTHGPQSSPAAAATQPARVAPTFYTGSFDIAEPAGTFLDLRNFHFGVVWVNGHNLGRYWDRGGLRSLFLSGHFLTRGKNQITVLELQQSPVAPQIATATKLIETPFNAFPYNLPVNRPTPSTLPTTVPGPAF